VAAEFFRLIVGKKRRSFGEARRPLLFSELLWSNGLSAAFPLDFFSLVGLCCCSVLSRYASGVLKRAIDQRAVTSIANE
jgi:hypothetical protein